MILLGVWGTASSHQHAFCVCTQPKVTGGARKRRLKNAKLQPVCHAHLCRRGPSRDRMTASLPFSRPFQTERRRSVRAARTLFPWLPDDCRQKRKERGEGRVGELVRARSNSPLAALSSGHQKRELRQLTVPKEWENATCFPRVREYAKRTSAIAHH